VLTETVFAYPGIGSLIYEAVGRQDFPILQGAFIVLAVTVVLANLLTDMVCLVLDPKLRTGNRA
jgi:ABC-type dipeptide/oligopeptide/nickel transport system permease component